MPEKRSIFSRDTVLVILFTIFFIGIGLAAETVAGSRQALYNEHDKHLSELASTADHNIEVVLNRCRVELEGLVKSSSFRESERQYQNGGNGTELREILKTSAVLLTEYADRIIVEKNGIFVLSTAPDDGHHYSIFADTDGDDIWLCADERHSKSYIALSCPSEVNDTVYFVLIDPEEFFRRVVVDSVYEDHWIVLYDEGSGMALQNDNEQPEYKRFSEEEIVARKDGYSEIFKHCCTGEQGISRYQYTSDSGEKQDVRIYVIPAVLSENGIFTISVAVYNENISAPMRKMTVNSILAAALIAFSTAAAAFMLLHSGKREKELADEISSLEKEKRLRDELLERQEQLTHHQKLETIGTLTAGIAHEFNNLLSPIMGNSMLILEKTRIDNPEVFDNALEIYQASDRAKELVSKISKLSRRSSVIQMKQISPSKLIDDVISMSAASIPGNIAVKKEILTDRLILGDENQLEHMLLNLVINAVQAMKPEDGVLTLTADSDGRSVFISVSDTGKGIPEELLSSIFDPFFTTKEAGKGTGLGLAIAQRTATNHAGKITAENLPQGGAKFTFSIPSSDSGSENQADEDIE